MNRIGIVAFVCIGSLGLMAPRAGADGWDQKTRFTFSGPVEIPGHELSAGTYVFKLVDSASDRDVVQVFNEDETHLVGVFLAIPDYHLKPAGKPIITFSERPAGSPEAVRAWFYPGENYGHAFVYSRRMAAQLARANREAVASMEDEPGSDATVMKHAHLRSQQPTGEETEIPREAPPAQDGSRK
jgi:hypothetical protein